MESTPCWRRKHLRRSCKITLSYSNIFTSSVLLLNSRETLKSQFKSQFQELCLDPDESKLPKTRSHLPDGLRGSWASQEGWELYPHPGEGRNTELTRGEHITPTLQPSEEQDLLPAISQDFFCSLHSPWQTRNQLILNNVEKILPGSALMGNH